MTKKTAPLEWKQQPMKHYHKNPRQITEKQFNDLKAWLEEYGDLSGIVHNVKTDEIIGGNQRAEAMHFMNGTKPVITHEYKKPTKQGTIAQGYFEYKGERFNYRRVQWSEKKAEYANMIANKGGGDFDIDIMANEWDVDVLLDTGWKEFELSLAGFTMGEKQDTNKEWEGMPEFDNPAKAYKSIMIHFENKKDYKNFCGFIGQELTEKTKSIWYPEKERRNMKEVAFESKS